jgi:hypothetical protein
VLKDEDGHRHFLVHPELRAMVEGYDLPYLEPLLRDLKERAQFDPDGVFTQLSSLAVGPLVTTQVGPNIADSPSLVTLCSRFVEF